MTADDRLPFTCLVPDAPGVVEVFDQTGALRMAVVEREAVADLGMDWDAAGTYILLDPPGADREWTAYVGKAPAGLRQRLMSHVRNKDRWVRALLVQRDTTHGFNSAHTAWLEGRLYDLVTASQRGTLHNGQRPGDDTLPPYDRQMLETTIDPISRVLRLIGYEPAPPGDEPESASRRRTPMRYTTSVSDLIDAGLLSPGQRLVSTYGGYPADAVVGGGGEIVWDGAAYATPSSAGHAVRGGKSTNGWAFWAVETEAGKETLATLRTRLGSAAAGPGQS
jgi:hypothetical protein